MATIYNKKRVKMKKPSNIFVFIDILVFSQFLTQLNCGRIILIAILANIAIRGGVLH
jgi:hypothetical protein